MEDKALTCKVCGLEFIWSIGEQEFYRDKELKPPARCHGCRPSARREDKRREEKINGGLLQSP